MIRHFLSRQFLGFVGVGATAAAANWVSRVLFGHWVSFTWSVVLAYGVGMAVAFTLNSIFVFPGSDKPRDRKATEFVLVNLGFLPIVWIGAIAIEHALQQAGMRRFTESIAHALALAIPMFGSFLIYKFVTFKGSQHER
jgi:putative flippase GtrA